MEQSTVLWTWVLSDASADIVAPGCGRSRRENKTRTFLVRDIAVGAVWFDFFDFGRTYVLHSQLEKKTYGMTGV